MIRLGQHRRMPRERFFSRWGEDIVIAAMGVALFVIWLVGLPVAFPDGLTHEALSHLCIVHHCGAGQ